MKNKIRVLIVDDSALMREALKTVLSSDPVIEIVGEACDGIEGVRKVFDLKPDVITMDLKMPLMGGLDAIEKIMEETPVPIIVVSGMNVGIILKALSIGAMDFVAVTGEIDEIAKDLIEKIKIAANVTPIRRMKIEYLKKKAAPALPKKRASKVVAIGVSTGGPQALQVILSKLPTDFNAAVIIVQHISPGFIEGLAEWLKLSSTLDVRVAKSGDMMTEHTVFIAPDNYHINIDNDGMISLKEDTTRHELHVPSINKMMKSIADSYGEGSIGVIMTGMGEDGVEGIKAIKEAGGFTIAQDEATSTIFGMNRSAIKAGYVDKVLAIDRIAEELTKAVR